MGRPAVEDVYLAELVARLGDVHAVVLSGSAALGGYDRARSDLDVMVVVTAPLAAEQRDGIVARCSHAALPCPARKLELVVYTAEQVATPRRDQRWELNLDTGADEQHVGTNPAAEPWFWFVLDLALAREHGIALRGPAPQELIGAPGRDLVMAAQAEAIAWYARNEPGEGALLAAARAWRYAEEGVFVSKRQALEWACRSR